MRNCIFVLLLLTLMICGVLAQHETPQSGLADQDSIPSFSIETIIVTADRQNTKIANTTSSVSVLNTTDFVHLPVMKFCDALSVVPGFFVVNKDGIGRDPIVTTRGFYGGGEAEYLLVLVDGRPINNLESGLVDWNLVPIKSISSVEVSRGSASPMYGDVALGGVMNILTHGLNGESTTLSIDGGSYGIVNGIMQQNGLIGRNPYKFSIGNERSAGYRDHSEWKATSFNGNITFPQSDFSKLSVSVNGQFVKADDPGPLSGQDISTNPQHATPYYKVDGKDENRQTIAIEHLYSSSPTSELSTLFYYNRRASDGSRTFTTPAQIVDFSNGFNIIGIYDTTFYGDTKERDLKTHEYGINLKFSTDNKTESFRNRFIAGIDFSYGTLKSTYYDMFKGFENDYRLTNPTRGNKACDGDASRGKFALFSNIEQHFYAPLTISVGGRFDVINDQYNGSLPDTNFAVHNSAVSLKYGANYEFMKDADFSGNLYASFNRSFKAPTLDQLSDQRPIDAALFTKFSPVGPYTFIGQPFPPFSNNTLRPQTASSYEVGIYQKLKITGKIYSEHTISFYRTDIIDEIDFDIQTFRYRNIQNSRHAGIEFGSKFYVSPSVSGFFNYAWSSVKFTSGNNQGNYLKSLPKNVFAAGANWKGTDNIHTSLDWNFVNETYLDDENTTLLGNFNYGSMKIEFLIGNFTISADVQNILNKQYNSTGYIEYGTAFYFPSAGRILHGGISVDL